MIPFFMFPFSAACSPRRPWQGDPDIPQWSPPLPLWQRGSKFNTFCSWPKLSLFIILGCRCSWSNHRSHTWTELGRGAARRGEHDHDGERFHQVVKLKTINWSQGCSISAIMEVWSFFVYQLWCHRWDKKFSNQCSPIFRRLHWQEGRGRSTSSSCEHFSPSEKVSPNQFYLNLHTYSVRKKPLIMV